MKRLAFAVALLIGLATPSQADYQDGLVAYSRGDYATALLEFKPLAERETPWRSSSSASCTAKARASYKTMPRR